MAARGVTGLIVNRHAIDGQSIAAIDTDGLNGSVLDVEVVNNGRAGQTMGSEELGLGLATVTSLPIPPAGTVGVELRTAGTGDSDILALDLQHRTCPLLVAPSGGTLEDNLNESSKSLFEQRDFRSTRRSYMGSIVHVAQVQWDARGDSHVGENDSCAGLLRSAGRSSTIGARESTGSTLLKTGGSGDGRLSNGRGRGASYQSCDSEIVENLRHCDGVKGISRIFFLMNKLWLTS